MSKLFKNPAVRLAIRALLAGVAVFVSREQAAADPLAWTIVEGSLSAAGWAALEAFTPLNSLVGYFKH